LQIVATSREPLDIAGERVWPLSPLDVPPATASRDEVEQSTSGALFLARLPTDAATRSLDDEDVRAVAAVCRSLDGIPLGLELAAARTRTLSLADLAERLEHSIGDLAVTGHGVETRHRTMRAALDWGFGLLSPSAQTALRAMSVFVGGCDLDAFAAVCVDGDSLPADAVLDELVRTSFAVVDHSAERTRYRLLEPVRQYAGELLDTVGEREQRQQRHVLFYRDLAVALHGGETEPLVPIPFDRLTRELGNFRVAIDWAAGHDVEAGLSLVACLYSLWENGLKAEGVARTVALLRTGGGSADARSQAARAGGILAANNGDFDLGLTLGEQALEEALGGASDPVFEGRARQVLAHAYADHGDIAAARRQLDAAMQLDTERTDEGLREFCLVSKAIVESMAANFDDAAAAADEVVRSPWGKLGWTGTSSLAVLGIIMFERGDLDRARSWLAEAIALGDEIDDPFATGAHVDLVSVECAAGRVDVAESHFQTALELLPEADRGADFVLFVARSDLALHAREPIRAGELAAAALAWANQNSAAWQRCIGLRRLGDAQLAGGDPDSALSTFQQLIARARAAPYPCREAEGHEGTAAAAVVLGKRQTARRHLDAAAEIRQRTGTRRIGRPWIDRHLAELEAAESERRLSESDR
jgi:predicted ATPase